MSLATILGYSGGALFIVFTILQIAPIKVNPWSYIAKGIGRAINSSVMDELHNLKEEVKTIKTENSEIKKSLDDAKAESARARILRFADEMMLGQCHSKDSFDQTMLDCDKYEDYCARHDDFKNSIASTSIERIKAQYRECLEKGKFL